MNESIAIRIEEQAAEIRRVFQLQHDNRYRVANTTARERTGKLDRLHKAILRYRDAFKEALYKDFRKHPSEVDLTETLPLIAELRHAKKNLRRWMRPQKAGTPLTMTGSSSWIRYEPKGVVLIISPWNFPFNLTLGPLISAIAAGNTVILKPSEQTPNASAVMKTMIGELFPENEVALFEGGVETSRHLLECPFNHIFFTGSASVGKIVMKAAANHLASVTLELGGKSPAIVDETANIDLAARRIAWGKFLNNGQICISPDYVYVHSSKADEFVEKTGAYLVKYYSENPEQAPSCARMVNRKHFEKVKGYVEDALDKGANVVAGARFNENENYIAPTILTDVPADSSLMQEEIFGPVLPVLTYTGLREVTDSISEREKPLALYIYSRSKKNIRFLLDNTRAGGSCINHNLVHFFNVNLPFGGSNNSGIGKGHGWYGFRAFSNERGVLRQHLPSLAELLLPPYNSFKQKLIDLTVRYF